MKIFCKIGWHSYWDYSEDWTMDLRCHRCGKKKDWLKEIGFYE